MIWFHVQLNQKILDSIYSKVSRILLKKPQIIICPAYLNDFYNLKSTAVCCDIFSCNLCSHKSFTYRIFVLGSSLKFAVSKKKWYFVTKIVLTVRKNCSSDRETLLKFEGEGQEFAKFLRSLKQFIQTVKGQNNFW